MADTEQEYAEWIIGKRQLPKPKGDTERWFPELALVDDGRICIPPRVKSLLTNALFDHALNSVRREFRLEKDKEMLKGKYIPTKVGKPGVIEALEEAIFQEKKEQEAIVRVGQLIADSKCGE